MNWFLIGALDWLLRQAVKHFSDVHSHFLFPCQYLWDIWSAKCFVKHVVSFTSRTSVGVVWREKFPYDMYAPKTHKTKAKFNYGRSQLVEWSIATSWVWFRIVFAIWKGKNWTFCWECMGRCMRMPDRYMFHPPTNKSLKSFVM